MSASKIAKTIIFTAQAHEHHNAMKISHVLKWLKTGHQVRVQISGKSDRHKAMDSIYKQIERELKTGAKFLQKVVKPEYIKFTLEPTPDAANIVLDESKVKISVEEEINDIVGDKDIFSGEFENELNQSIQKERQKNKKK